MITRVKTAFVLYFFNSLLSIIFGFKYLFCDSIMQYHQQAIDMDWSELEYGLQLLLNGLIKIATSCFFIVAISSITLLLIPFRKGERWAMWLVPLIQILFLVFATYVPLNLAIKTNASTPWPFSIIATCFVIIAFLLSGINVRQKRNNNQKYT